MFVWTYVWNLICSSHVLSCFLVRQLAFTQQVRHLEERGPLRQLLDGVPSIAEDALVTVNVRDGATACRGVHERGIVGHHPEIIVCDLDLPEIGGLYGPLGNRQLVTFSGPIVRDGDTVLRQAIPRRDGSPERRLHC